MVEVDGMGDVYIVVEHSSYRAVLFFYQVKCPAYYILTDAGTTKVMLERDRVEDIWWSGRFFSVHLYAIGLNLLLHFL